MEFAMIRFTVAILLLLLGSTSLAQADDLRGFTADDLVRLDRVSSPAVSPDGESVAFVLRETDMEANRGRTDIWVMGADGSDARRLTTDPAGDFSPVWAPDGRSLYFLSTRTESSQVWRLDMAGGEAQPVSDLPLDVGDLKVMPDASGLVFSMEVFVDCPDIDCTVERRDEEKDTTGVVYDSVFVRHWDHWKDGRRRHVFFAPLSDGELGDPVDLMPGMDADAPSKPWGGAEEIAIHPDGGFVFTARDAGPGEPWSTNFDLYWVSEPGATPVNLTDANEAWDTAPAFSPDGKSLVWLAMSVPDYEADRYRILRASFEDGALGEWVEVAPEWDRSPGSISWASDGKWLLTHTNHLGHRGLFAIRAKNGEVRELYVDGSVAGEVESKGRVFFTRDSFATPADIWSVKLNGKDAVRLTALNEDRLSGVDMDAGEQFTFTGANGDTVYGWIVKPANFDPAQKYPVAFLIHGGPQGSFGSNFHYRWNPQTYAGAGYAAVMIDFHGSTGYGQEFCDSIRDNWGGWPLEDLQLGLVDALARYEWLDGDRVAALGASYGGYRINWIAGNWPDRFKALVVHDGNLDERFAYFATEELWFPEWEHGGTPWENPQGYEKHNPVDFVKNWKTPMLVIHGGKDYRVVDTGGFASFTALQRMGIPSKLLYFPDENHWVLKPANSILWHDTVLDWLDLWTKRDSRD
jgi:dipeptidyl aminopeptidase/acylaminoacyl peptidase